MPLSSTEVGEEVEMNRREFLKRAACLAAVPAFGGCRSLFSGKPGDFDDDLMVLDRKSVV